MRLSLALLLSSLAFPCSMSFAETTVVSNAASLGGIAIDPLASWSQSASLPCQTLGGYSVVTGACMSYPGTEGSTYLGWYATQGSIGLSAETEMAPGAGQTDGVYVHVMVPTLAQNAFGGEWDLNNIAADGTTHHRVGIDIVGQGALSASAVKITGVSPNWGQWVNGLVGSGQVLGPTLADTSNDSYVYEFAGGGHMNMMVAGKTAGFAHGFVHAQSDPPKGSNDDVIWESLGSATSAGSWSLGSQKSDGSPCVFCVTTPSKGGVPIAPLAVGTDGALVSAGSVAISTANGTVRRLVSSAAGTRRLSLSFLSSDPVDLAGPGSATLYGTLTCLDASNNSASWSVTQMWDLSTGRLLGSKVSPIAVTGVMASLSSALLWSVGMGTTAMSSLPALSVNAPFSTARLSCKADQELIVVKSGS